MNCITLSGRLTQDPALAKTAAGTSYCRFRLAVRRPYTTDKTDFISCTAWQWQADFLTGHAKKGDLIELSGYLECNQSEDANGRKSDRYSVNTSMINMLQRAAGNRPQTAGNAPVQAPQATPQTAPYSGPTRPRDMSDFSEIGNDDLPF